MMSRSRWGAAGLTLAASMVAAGPVTASVFLQVDLPALTKMSASVVHARVIDVRSAWNDDGTFIFTYVTLKVEETFRGASQDTVVVRVPGGRVGDYVAEMEGAPLLMQDDDVVAFIGRWEDGAPMIAGYFEGVSRVEKDAHGNRFLRGGKAHGMPISELARAVARVEQ